MINAIDKQSPDIAQGVDRAWESRIDPGDDDELDLAGAGDQGMMFGYASNETEELMPLPISLAHKLAKRLADVRRAEILPYLRPDGKTQVTVRYVDGRPVEVEKVLISTQHRDGAESLLKDDLWEHVIEPVMPEELYDARKLHRTLLVNPTGRFVIGGPMGDCGLTGRKIIVDTYGGMARHGGGAFTGKDPSKVDRSAAYAARYVAKNVVAAGLADRAEVQVAYAIGVAHPVSVMVETFGTEKVPRSKILELINEHFDLRPGAFRQYLRLHRPIYQKTAAYGHFGREDHDFTWERTDKAAGAAGRAVEPAAVSVARRLRAVDDALSTAVAARQRRPQLRCGWCQPRELVQRPVDRADDPRRVVDAAEPEVVRRAAGGVEVDRADPEQPLEQPLARVDVLDALEPRLVHLAREQPGSDRQPPVGDRVGRADPPDQPPHQHDHEDRRARRRRPSRPARRRWRSG